MHAFVRSSGCNCRNRTTVRTKAASGFFLCVLCVCVVHVSVSVNINADRYYYRAAAAATVVNVLCVKECWVFFVVVSTQRSAWTPVKLDHLLQAAAAAAAAAASQQLQSKWVCRQEYMPFWD